jgi:uncharacterized protein (TIGR03437 family)
MKKWVFVYVVFTVLAKSQAPVVEARGVVNGVTFELAPSTVAPGGIFNIYGFNLASGTAAASSVPLPNTLGSPAVEVLVNGRRAPLYFVSAGQINAQVPWETEPGPAQVVVRHSGVSSRAATMLVQPAQPSLFARNGAGFGPAIAVRAGGGLVSSDNLPAGGEVVVLYASGLGPVEPATGSGAAGPADPLSRAVRPQRAWISGFPAPVLFAGLAPGFVGLFQINLQLPETFSRGDVIQYFSGPTMGNRLTLGSAAEPRVRLMALPEGQGNVTGIIDASLNGGFVAINGPRGGDGCYQNVHLLDFRRNRTTRVEECLIHQNQNAPSPFVSENQGPRLGALIGPASGSPPAGISQRVLIADGATGRTTIVELPAPASGLQPVANGAGLVASLPGEPARAAAINTVTGEVQILQGGAGPGGGGAAALLGGNLNVDGLTQLVSTVAILPNNRLVVVVADSDTDPQRAMFAVLSPNGTVQTRAAFPEGYLPLLPPRPAAAPAPGPGGGLPGGGPGQIPGGGAGPAPGGQFPGIQAAPRAGLMPDAASGRVLALARARDNSRHALVIFDANASTTRVTDFASGVFAAACSPALRALPLTLAGKLALPVTDRVETAATVPCAATALLVFDAGGSMNRLGLPESGTLDVNSVNALNDYLYGVNADRLSQNSSSLYVYDPVTEVIRKLGVPRGATGFTTLQPLAATGQLLAVASNRLPGDEGLILFDLGSGGARLFPVPEGFSRVANPGLHLATRRITSRALRSAGDGWQVVVFDPATGASLAIGNPERVQSIGGPAAQAPQAPVIFQRNQDSNSILAAGYGAGDRLMGLVLLEAF